MAQQVIVSKSARLPQPAKVATGLNPTGNPKTTARIVIVKGKFGRQPH